MKQPVPQNPSQILLLMLGAIGDILVTTPTMRALRNHYPAARMMLAVRKPYAELLYPGDIVDEVCYYPRGFWHKIIWALRLRRKRIDLYIDLHTPVFNTVTSNTRVFARNAVLAWLIGARTRTGYRSGLNAWALTTGLAARGIAISTPVVELTLALLNTLAIPQPAVIHKELFFTAADAAIAAHLLPPAWTDYACIHAGSNQEPNRWSAASFAAVCAHIFTRHRLPIVLLGGPGDVAENESIRALLPASLPVLDLAGRASLRATAALIAQARILVCLDSGPMHMGDAIGVPQVIIFSCLNYPGLWQPLNKRSISLRGPDMCAPCVRMRCPRNGRMTNVSPQEAIAAVDTLLQQDGSA